MRSDPSRKGSSKVKGDRKRVRLVMSADGMNVVNHVGARLLAAVADAAAEVRFVRRACPR